MSMVTYDLIFLACGGLLLYVIHAGSHAVGHAHAGGHGEEAGHEDHGSHEHKGPSYLAIFGALVVLTLIELAVPNLMKAHAASTTAVLMALACVKALLVALFFMHLKTEGQGIYFVCALTIVCVLFMFGPVAWDIQVVYGS